MKLFGVVLALVLAAIGGTVILKRLGRVEELPVEGFDTSVPLTPVPGIKEPV